jgi:hypothetical protein
MRTIPLVLVASMSADSTNTDAWPWGEKPPPESVRRQQIKSRHFRGDTYPPSTFPGGPIPTSYVRFSGIGPPPNEVGRPGDIYVDNSPESLGLYGRHQLKWLIWPGPGLLFRHPTLDDRYLWCSEQQIAWYPGKFVVDDAKARSTQTKIDMIQQALKSEAECDSPRTEGDEENQQSTDMLENAGEEDNRSGKRASSDRTACDDSGRPKRIKFRHERSTNVEEPSCRQEEEVEDSGSSECSSEATDIGSKVCNLQKEALMVQEQRGWWLHTIAKMCQRCPQVEARVGNLENEKRTFEAIIRALEERCAKEEQERHRLAALCAKLMAEKGGGDDREKAAAENRNLEALHKQLNGEIERLGQNITALRRKVWEDEQQRLELQNMNARQEQRIAALLEENKNIKSRQQSTPRDADVGVTSSGGTRSVPESILNFVPGKIGQTLHAHMESRESQESSTFLANLTFWG